MTDPQVAKQIARLKNDDEYVRHNAADVLGEIGDASAVPALIDTLKDKSEFVRRTATVAVKKIGASSIPALIAGLRSQDNFVRLGSFDALVGMGDTSAVPALIALLKDENETVCCAVADALGVIGDTAAVPALIATARHDKRAKVRNRAVEAAWKIGDSGTLSRKILADSRFSAQERIDILKELRRIRYDYNTREGADSPFQDVTFRYIFPETSAFCRMVLTEDDAEVCKGAQAVLNWLNGEQHLLHASQPNTGKLSHELLRPTQSGETETKPDTLLRASNEPEQAVKPPQAQPTAWQRLLGKRKGRLRW